MSGRGEPTASPSDTEIRTWAEASQDARRRTLALIADLDDVQLMGPRVGTVSPLRWEVGHLAWFQERWTLRRDGQPSILANADGLYDSIAVEHSLRWDLPLPTRARTVQYLDDVLAAALERVNAPTATAEDLFHHRYTTNHEDMHAEALAYGRQTLGYPTPSFCAPVPACTHAGSWDEDVQVPAGSYAIGVGRDEGFAFDNERGQHRRELAAFSIAKAPVTQAQFAAFVEDGGYQTDAHWSPAGLAWKRLHAVEHPIYWRRAPQGWQRRCFTSWQPLEPTLPMVHVASFEAEAWCRWAGRRLPTEAEWEVAARWDPSAARMRRYPWGDTVATPGQANLDGRHASPVDVAAFEAGDSALGCRQMVGNVWEWTADAFEPYPGFVADPYREYSLPWFFSHRVLRGGSFMARARLMTATYRNYATATRRDLFAGFRTCAIR